MRDAVGGWRTLFTKSSVCVGPNAKRQKGPPSTDGPPDGSKSRFYGILFWQWLPFPPAVFAETRRPRSSYRFAYGRRASAAAAIGKRSYHGHWGPDHTSTGQNSRDTPPLYLVPLARWATSRPRLAAKVTPSPQPGLGAYKGTLRGPAAKIAPGQVAGNSNHFCGHLVKGRHRTP